MYWRNLLNLIERCLLNVLQGWLTLFVSKNASVVQDQLTLILSLLEWALFKFPLLKYRWVLRRTVFVILIVHVHAKCILRDLVFGMSEIGDTQPLPVM